MASKVNHPNFTSYNSHEKIILHERGDKLTDKKFLSVSEMAELMNISLSGAYQLIHRPEFPALRVGRRVIIPYDRLMIWVDENLGINQD